MHADVKDGDPDTLAGIINIIFVDHRMNNTFQSGEPFISPFGPTISFNLGMSAGGVGIFSVYRTNGKQVRIIHARPFEPEERFFYQRKMDQTLSP